MPRGFTFIELLISLLVISILLAGAAPGFDSMYKHYQAKRLASEFMGFFSQARSEAVMRNQALYIHFEVNGTSNNGWILALRKSADGVNYNTAATGAVMISKGEGEEVSFNLGGNPPPSNLKLGQVNGKPNQGGNITFALATAPDKKLKLMFFNITGRFRICGVGGTQYGYLSC